MITNIPTLALLGAAIVSTALVNEASARVPTEKAAKAPKGYHLDGFRGWANGYHVDFTGCAPLAASCTRRDVTSL